MWSDSDIPILLTYFVEPQALPGIGIGIGWASGIGIRRPAGYNLDITTMRKWVGF